MMAQPIIKILKRQPNSEPCLSQFDNGMLNKGEAKNRPIKTLEEREAAYAEARMRILGSAHDNSAQDGTNQPVKTVTTDSTNSIQSFLPLENVTDQLNNVALSNIRDVTSATKEVTAEQRPITDTTPQINASALSNNLAIIYNNSTASNSKVSNTSSTATNALLVPQSNNLTQVNNIMSSEQRPSTTTLSSTTTNSWFSKPVSNSKVDYWDKEEDACQINIDGNSVRDSHRDVGKMNKVVVEGILQKSCDNTNIDATSVDNKDNGSSSPPPLIHANGFQ